MAATPDPAALRFVKPPLVIVQGEGSGVQVWARLNRPLRHNLGAPGELEDTPARFEFAGSVSDVSGMFWDPVRPTCYSEYPHVRAGALPAAGTPLEVSLVLSETQRITAMATVRDGTREPRTEPVRELGCASKPPAGTRRTRRCQGIVTARHMGAIGVRAAKGTSCRTARAVLRSVGRWASSSHCFEDLCVRAHRTNRGYRCEVARTGEADWDILCRRGRAEVWGNASE